MHPGPYTPEPLHSQVHALPGAHTPGSFHALVLPQLGSHTPRSLNAQVLTHQGPNVARFMHTQVLTHPGPYVPGRQAQTHWTESHRVGHQERVQGLPRPPFHLLGNGVQMNFKSSLVGKRAQNKRCGEGGAGVCGGDGLTV